MPAYSYKERFVPMVKDGSKPHTIRARRKHAPKPGDPLYHYFGMRTKFCTKLAEDVCADVRTIVIDGEDIYLFDKRIDNDKDAEYLQESLEKYPDLMDYAKCYEGYYFHKLSNKERDRLAWQDGFRPDGSSLKNPKNSFQLMNRFWNQTHELPFVGDIIYRSKK